MPTFPPRGRERDEAAAREALGDDPFAYAEGQAMTLEQAVEYALRDEGLAVVGIESLVATIVSDPTEVVPPTTCRSPEVKLPHVGPGRLGQGPSQVSAGCRDRALPWTA